jgi:hypothetical protein
MRTRRRSWARTAPIAVCVAALGLVGVVPPAASAASPLSPGPYLLTTRIHVGPDARMVYANGNLFVSSGSKGSAVFVYSPAGKLLHSITGEPGAAGMVLSADGGTLYVAQSAGDKISEIDTSTFAHSELPVDSCPTNVALAAGRLFYSFGCDPGADTSGVSSIDPTSGGTPVPTGDPLPTTPQMIYAPPVLEGAGDVLAVLGVGVEPAQLQTYTASADGDVSTLGDLTDSNAPRDMSISSDGAHLLVANAISGFTEYATATMHQEAAFNVSAGFAAGVALSPDGTHFAGGVQGPGGLVSLYDTTSSTPIWQRLAATSLTSTWTDGLAADVLPGSLTFAADGAQVYGLVSAAFSNAPFLFASSIATSATSLHLSVKSSGASHPVSVSATLSTPGTVVFKEVSNRQTRVVGTVATNSNGVARLTFTSPFNGSVHALYEGSLTTYPAAAAQSYKIASKARVLLSGSYATRHSVMLFRGTNRVHFLATVSPGVPAADFQRIVKASLEYDHAGKWHVVGTLDDGLNKNGVVRFKLGTSASNTLTRVKVSFHGDRLNPGSRAFSPIFEIT